MSCAVLTLVNKERKRQYSALRRAVYREAPPALVAKFSLATDGERPFGVNLCRAYLATKVPNATPVDPGEGPAGFYPDRREVQAMGREPEDGPLRDRPGLIFRADTLCDFEVTVFQLEKLYGRSADAKSFIKDLCAGAFGSLSFVSFISLKIS